MKAKSTSASIWTSKRNNRRMTPLESDVWTLSFHELQQYSPDVEGYFFRHHPKRRARKWQHLKNE